MISHTNTQAAEIAWGIDMMRRKLVRAILASAALSVASASAGKEDPRIVARRVFDEVYAKGRLALVDELYSETFVDDSPGGGLGRDVIREAAKSFHQASSNLRFQFEDVFTNGEKVVLRYTATGTHTGPFVGLQPTGRQFAIRGITIFQFHNGKIQTEWTEYDRLGMLRILGAIPAASDR